MSAAATGLLGAIRPDEHNLALFVHVLGAMALVGATTFAATSLAGAWRGGSLAATRTAFKTLLWAVIPAWIVMRIGAQWIADKEGWLDLDEPPAWIDIGFITAEPFFLFVVIATVLAGLAVRRAGAGAAEAPSRGVRVATGLVAVTLLAYVVAIWAMTAKPA